MIAVLLRNMGKDFLPYSIIQDTVSRALVMAGGGGRGKKVGKMLILERTRKQRSRETPGQVAGRQCHTSRLMGQLRKEEEN